jgi:hypothetical protein
LFGFEPELTAPDEYLWLIGYKYVQFGLRVTENPSALEIYTNFDIETCPQKLRLIEQFLNEKFSKL